LLLADEIMRSELGGAWYYHRATDDTILGSLGAADGVTNVCMRRAFGTSQFFTP